MRVDFEPRSELKFIRQIDDLSKEYVSFIRLWSPIFTVAIGRDLVDLLVVELLHNASHVALCLCATMRAMQWVELSSVLKAMSTFVSTTFLILALARLHCHYSCISYVLARHRLSQRLDWLHPADGPPLFKGGLLKDPSCLVTIAYQVFGGTAYIAGIGDPICWTGGNWLYSAFLRLLPVCILWTQMIRAHDLPVADRKKRVKDSLGRLALCTLL
jgi:hypothetical protein